MSVAKCGQHAKGVAASPHISLRLQHVTGKQSSSHCPIVFVHGWGSDSALWQPLVARLTDTRDVILIDLPGFGVNDDVDVDSCDDLIKYMAEVLPPHCVMVGWSLGGMIATQFASSYPARVDGLFTIAANAKFVVGDEWAQACDKAVFASFLTGFEQAPREIIQRFILLQAQGDSDRKQVRQILKTNVCEPEPDVCLRWLLALQWLAQIDNRDALCSLPMPHCALFGERDALVPAACAESFIARGFASEVHVLAGCGHAPHLSRLDDVFERLTALIERSESWKQDSSFTTQDAATSTIVLDLGAQAKTITHAPRDKIAVAKSFSRASADYDAIASFQFRVAQSLVTAKKEYVGTIADLGCGTGFCAQAIDGEDNTLIAMDIAEGMLQTYGRKLPHLADQRVCGDIESLPFADEQLNGIVSSLCFQWSDSLSDLFAEARRCLSDGGWMLFSTLGPRTLFELQQAWCDVDDFVHINQFADIATVVDAYQQHGFRARLHRQSDQALSYEDVYQLMRDLKGIGARNMNPGKKTGLSTRKTLRQLEQAYEEFRGAEGLPATYEVHYFLLEV